MGKIVRAAFVGLGIVVLMSACKLTGDGSKRVCRQDKVSARCTCVDSNYDQASDGDKVDSCSSTGLQAAVTSTSGALCCLDTIVTSESHCYCQAVTCIQSAPPDGKCRCSFDGTKNMAAGDTIVATCTAPSGGTLCSSSDLCITSTTKSCSGVSTSVGACDATTMAGAAPEPFCLNSEKAVSDCTNP